MPRRSCVTGKLITLDELQEIRRIWVTDEHKNEIEDLVPAIYEAVIGRTISWSADRRPISYLTARRWSYCGINAVETG